MMDMFPSRPDGDYNVTLIRLSGNEKLGVRNAADLREIRDHPRFSVPGVHRHQAYPEGR
jgi:hypothetical protein